MTKTEKAVQRHFNGLIKITSKLHDTPELNKQNDYFQLMTVICSIIQEGGEIRFRITHREGGRNTTFDHYINEVE